MESGRKAREDFGLTVIPILMLGLAFVTPFALVIGSNGPLYLLHGDDGIITLVAGLPFFGTYDSSFQISFRIGYTLFLTAFALDSIHELSMTRVGKYIVIAFTIVMSLAISHHITVEPSELTLSEASEALHFSLFGSRALCTQATLSKQSTLRRR